MTVCWWGLGWVTVSLSDLSLLHTAPAVRAGALYSSDGLGPLAGTGRCVLRSAGRSFVVRGGGGGGKGGG